MQLFFFVVAMGDLVYDVKTMHDLCSLLTATGKLFLNGKLHIAVSWASLVFQKRFPDAVSI